MNGNWILVRYWGLGFLGTVIAVTVSYLWLDRPIARLAHEALQQFHLFDKLSLIPDGLIPVAVVTFLVLGLRGLTGPTLSRFQTVLLVSGISLAVAVVIKDQLKYAFGRTWPETWLRNNPSFIRDNVFGFFPFNGGSAYSSFPSGHATVICTVMAVFWLCYPKFRPVYALCIAATAVGLVGANFHFLSDVIAGGFLGAFVGWLVVGMWEIGARKVRPIREVSEETESPLPPKTCEQAPLLIAGPERRRA
jgi:membrane-associated phospholipid phosphatase